MVGSRPGRVAFVVLLPLLLLGCGGAPAAPPPTTLGGGPLGDTWTFDGGDWARAAGPGPAARFDTAMAYDEARHVTILFGGSALLDQFDDTWSWDGRRWSRLHPIHHPVAISGHEMAYDAARRQVVLFGGAHGLYEKANPSTDTWTWDGRDWTMVSGGGPPSLNGQQMAFYPPAGQLILFGGSRGNTRYSDQTWAWDGRLWTLAEPAHRPSPRYGVALAFDPASGFLVLFGGAELKPDVGPGEAGLPMADQWAFSGEEWSALHPASTPGPRANATFARDPTEVTVDPVQRLVLPIRQPDLGLGQQGMDPPPPFAVSAGPRLRGGCNRRQPSPGGPVRRVGRHALPLASPFVVPIREAVLAHRLRSPDLVR